MIHVQPDLFFETDEGGGGEEGGRAKKFRGIESSRPLKWWAAN